MSYEADPRKTFAVILSHHLDRPESKRPAYHFRYLSIRDRGNFHDLIRRAHAYGEEIADVLGKVGEAGGDDQARLKDIAEAMDQLGDKRASKGQKLIDDALELVRGLFAGWTLPESPAGEPITGDFAPERLDEVIDESDLNDLLHTLPDESRLKAVDRKNFIARSIRNSADAAQTAAEQPEG
ncbi:MAG: hypothetical protein ACPGYV_08500 [Phycisphaeraceae bacterium]